MDDDETIDTIAAEQNWTASTLLGLLKDFIRETDQEYDCVEFLRERADESVGEDEESDDEDEDDELDGEPAND